MAMPALNPKTGPPEDAGWAVRAETTPTFFLLKQHCCLLRALMYLGHCQQVKEWDACIQITSTGSKNVSDDAGLPLALPTATLRVD